MSEIDLLAEYTVGRVQTNAGLYQQLLRSSAGLAKVTLAQGLMR
jgi:hypothetical protein